MISTVVVFRRLSCPTLSEHLRPSRIVKIYPLQYLRSLMSPLGLCASLVIQKYRQLACTVEFLDAVSGRSRPRPPRGLCERQHIRAAVGLVADHDHGAPPAASTACGQGRPRCAHCARRGRQARRPVRTALEPAPAFRGRAAWGVLEMDGSAVETLASGARRLADAPSLSGATCVRLIIRVLSNATVELQCTDPLQATDCYYEQSDIDYSALLAGARGLTVRIWPSLDASVRRRPHTSRSSSPPSCVRTDVKGVWLIHAIDVAAARALSPRLRRGRTTASSPLIAPPRLPA